MVDRRSPLQEELKQTRPFSTSEEEVLVAVMRTAALIRRAVARRIEPAGISGAQYNVLRILRGAGADGLPTLAVRDRLVEEAPGITRLMDKLESAGLVTRDRTGKDRRTVRCRITPEGREALEVLDHGVRDVHRLIARALPDARERTAVLDALSRVRGELLADR